MKKKNFLVAMIFFLMSIFSFSANQENNTILSRPEAIQIKQVSAADPTKLIGYVNLVEAIRFSKFREFNAFYSLYFTNSIGEFAIPDEIIVNRFLNLYESSQQNYAEIENLLNTVESRIATNPALGRLDIYARDFISTLRYERSLMGEIYQYFKSRRYLRDNFRYARVALHNPYHGAMYNSSMAYTRFYNSILLVLN